MKYNLTNIARRANALSRDMNKSLAWRKAWAEAKLESVELAWEEAKTERPAVWMPIREELFAKRDALYTVNQEAEAASPAMQRKALEHKLFCLKMADRPRYDERQEITRLEQLLAA